jgi:hypothetical protein
MYCLYCVIGKAFDWHDKYYRQFLEENNLWDHLSPEEISFMSAHLPEMKTALNLTWRVEALFLLMWAVQLFDSLPLPLEQTNTEEITSRLPSLGQSPWPFIHELELRPKSEILDASDLIYRLHWAIVQANLDGKPPPANLDPDVIYEWHYAVNWLTNYGNSDWDDVSTDT